MKIKEFWAFSMEKKKCYNQTQHKSVGTFEQRCWRGLLVQPSDSSADLAKISILCVCSISFELLHRTWFHNRSYIKASRGQRELLNITTVVFLF